MKVVIATDLSEHSADALRWADAYATQTGASLHVIHVIDDLGDDELWTVLFETPAELEKRVLEELTEKTREFVAASLGAQRAAGVRVVVGQPAEEVARYADDLDADLIVSGTSGHGRIRNAVFGSTAYRLPHATDRTTAFVPDGDFTPPVEHVLVAVDFSECSEAALAWVAKNLPSATITVAHSAGLTSISAMLATSPDFISTLTYLTEQRSKRLQKMLEEANIEADVVVGQDSPIEVILGACKDRNIDLVVMGTRGLGAMERFVMGSVTQQVLRETPVPVVTVHG